MSATDCARRLALTALLPVLAACAGGETAATDPAEPAPEAGAEDASTPRLTLPDQAAAEEPAAAAAPASPPRNVDPATVPVIYLALQEASGGTPASIVFTVDSSRDGTPSNERAIRITPQPAGSGQQGECSLQELNSYDFGELQPVFSAEQASAGVTVPDLPRYLAFVVSQALVDSGIAPDVEATAPQNICTRKFWELWLSQARTADASGR